MERLTRRYVDGQAWVSMAKVAASGEYECVGPAIDRLAAYEDTGLEPEKVEELKTENRGLKANKAIMEKILEGKHNPHDTALITRQMLQIAQLRSELEELNAPRLHELAEAEKAVLAAEKGDSHEKI